ncbi:phospholipid scramblase 1 isoform X1 [Pogonomyrmex barbatus]|uniref:Phospholipid scramblase n=2 Tax=Pogonomyrmex barbatus TaxID=144034 RepID=A0A6I9WT28_9HYME|nr:phospholipid scramblase 1 isoform X1 [Pogonomyrmex barbatus]XP_011642904.1 phospholipid scramblase 1 isoform X1 [Pogonomyrmex barbatus]XP_011642906.1 phospholipid scramblase 1 isoform X1 [Pogonomyrmex barbatus]XP_011642907.1 phospholipid scramblase 1 isoform X1 [Pogonomyrmex barbatus]XP_011642908.1 phospholipid scramblase 1 isoform X1 [Pogonomyrmex barbatus]
MDDQKYQPQYPLPGAGMQSPIATAPPPIDAPMSTGGWQPPSMIYPHGLESLINLDYLFVNQKIELLEAFTGWETKNKYVIMNNKGEPVFYMAEDSGVCWRLCLGKYRACEFNIFDKNQQQVLRMVRPFRCDGCCCPCYLQVLEVYSGNILLGSVTQEWSFWRPKFYIRDASGQPVLMIKGPLIRFCIDVIFKVKSLDDEHRLGMIRKQWSGFAQEFFTVSDKFGINFPRDLDVKIKAVLLGACLLIDFMYFEQEA